MSAPGGWVRRRYFSFVFLFDVGEESRIGEVPFATGAPEFSFRFFFGFYGLLVIASTFLFTHQNYKQGSSKIGLLKIAVPLCALTIRAIIHQSPSNIHLCMKKDNSGYYRFSNMEEVAAMSREQNRDLMTLDGFVIDPTTFAPHHPGGKDILAKHASKDVTAEMQSHHPRSLQLAQSMTIGSFKKEINPLLDPRKPLATQIWNLSQDDYVKVVQSPHWMFVPSPRLFEADWMEKMSYSKWYHVTFLPALVIAYMIWKIESWQTFNLITSLLTVICGVLSFTLVQYLLHRFIFHAEKWLPDNKVLRMFHFFLHGIHHLLPNDPHRLVLPPLYALLIVLLACPTILRIVRFTDPVLEVCFWSAFLIGYVLYDSTHYFLHFLDTRKVKMGWFQALQRYHNQHHYGGENAGFGVSSPLWDIILRTGFKVKKHST